MEPVFGSDSINQRGPLRGRQFLMTRKLLLTASLLGAINIARLEAQALPGPAPGRLEVIATNGAGREEHLSSRNGLVPLLLVRPNQTVPITLQFPSDKAGTPVAATPLDGGTVNGDRLGVLPTGKVIFTFKPGAILGRYRLMVQTPSERHLLEFYVVDPNDPGRKSRAPHN